MDSQLVILCEDPCKVTWLGLCERGHEIAPPPWTLAWQLRHERPAVASSGERWNESTVGHSHIYPFSSLQTPNS